MITNEISIGLDCITVIGLIVGIGTVAIYNPAMYGCIEPHWSRKFVLGTLLVVVSLAGMLK